jgi:hypothetical protein
MTHFERPVAALGVNFRNFKGFFAPFFEIEAWPPVFNIVSKMKQYRESKTRLTRDLLGEAKGDIA